MASSEVARKLLFRWLGWFAMANALVLAFVDLRYLSSGIGEQSPLSWLYLVTIYISHHSWLALLPIFLLLTPVILIRPSFQAAKWPAILIISLIIAVIVLDSLLWSQSRFHINLLTLQILGLSSWVFVLLMFFIALMFEGMLANMVWTRVQRSASCGGRWVAVLVTVCLFVSAGIYAWADASYYVPVTSVAEQLPVQRGFTAKKFLVRRGWVDVSQARERRLANRMAGAMDQSGGAYLNYPLQPLQCASPENFRPPLSTLPESSRPPLSASPESSRPPPSASTEDSGPPLNLLIILVDSMRSDMFNDQLTPNMKQFARERASEFSQHFSGGNSSRMGVFSLFYGLPPGYFDSFESIQKPPVLTSKLVANGYQMGLFSSSNMYRPVALDRTAFANIPNLRMETKPVAAPAWERDQIMTADWFDWMDKRDSEQPFFGFLFYDAVNVNLYPPDFEDKIALDPAIAMPQEFAHYQSSVAFDDELVGKVLADLEQRQLLDQTVVLITADHGQEFKENGDGISGHGSGYSRYQLQVPMLLAWPGRAPQTFDHRTSHYDVAPTLLKNLLNCQNPPTDYASGRDLYDGKSWDWLIAGSYYNYAVVEPHQTTVTFPSGRYEVRGDHYQLLKKPDINADVLEAVMRENTRFHQ